MCANAAACTAADTFFGNNMRFAVVVHFHFACTGTAAHTDIFTDIFNGAAKAGHFMSFKMGQADYNISVHQCLAYFRFFNEFTVRHGHIRLVRAL